MTRERLTEIIREVLAEEIRKINGKYVVYPKGGGKRLGTHDTRAEAEKQLTAIHLNKEGDEHKAMNPGILSRDPDLKGADGKIKISKVRQKLSSMKDKGSTKAKALRRFINYHD